MKALILAGGRGKRLDEIASQRNKCMIDFNGKPLIEYSLDCVAQTDIGEAVIIVGYRAEEIINHYGNSYKNKKLKYVIQWQQEGLVNAIDCAQEAIAGEDFLLLLGDEILVNPRHKEMLEEFNQTDVFALCGILRVENRDLIRRTYMIISDNQRVIYRLVEKPTNPLNSYMGTGNCLFRNHIFKYIGVTPIHHERKEKELPDLIQCAIDDGQIVKSFSICDRYTNINSKQDIEMAKSFFE